MIHRGNQEDLNTICLENSEQTWNFFPVSFFYQSLVVDHVFAEAKVHFKEPSADCHPYDLMMLKILTIQESKNLTLHHFGCILRMDLSVYR